MQRRDMQANKALWNELTPIHARSKFYDLEGFKRGKLSLKSIELQELGDVSGKKLLHLQCHFGMDTISWARLGAKVTGVDFSEKAIALSRSLSKELGIKVDFVCCNIYDLPKRLKGKYDIVFTSYGVLCWLSDLKRWAEIIAHFLKRGGVFYIIESHPFSWVFDDEPNTKHFKVVSSYFHSSKPNKFQSEIDYADRASKVAHPSYEWTHSLSDIINSLIDSGLQIQFVHEFPHLSWAAFPFMEQSKDGYFRMKGKNADLIPLMFSVKAVKKYTTNCLKNKNFKVMV